MAEKDWFLHKLSVLQDDYLRRDKENREAEMSVYRMWDADKAKSDALIHDLCRALARAQEIIIDLGEKSGNEELLKDAKVYANTIGGVTEPFTHYAEDTEVKKNWREAVKKSRKDKE